MVKLNRGPLLVTSAILVHNSEVLIAQRKQETELEPSKWEFPGGKVEHGESPEDCIKREIREELNLEISVQSLYHLTSHVYETPAARIHVVLLFYLCRLDAGDLRLLDVQDAKWVAISDLTNYAIAAADMEVLQKLLSRLG